MKQYEILSPKDSVAVALTDLSKGQEFDTPQGHITLNEPIARAHKFALKALAPGDIITKYGFPIGHATHGIKPGKWVHVHNMASNLDLSDLNYTYNPIPDDSEAKKR